MEENQKPAWYTPKGLPLWVVIVVILAILSLMLFLPTDHPLKLWVLLLAVAVAVFAYWYTHRTEPPVTQSNITAGGDVAGRDINRAETPAEQYDRVRRAANPNQTDPAAQGWLEKPE